MRLKTTAEDRAALRETYERAGCNKLLEAKAFEDLDTCLSVLGEIVAEHAARGAVAEHAACLSRARTLLGVEVER